MTRLSTACLLAIAAIYNSEAEALHHGATLVSYEGTIRGAKGSVGYGRRVQEDVEPESLDGVAEPESLENSPPEPASEDVDPVVLEEPLKKPKPLGPKGQEAELTQVDPVDGKPGPLGKGPKGDGPAGPLLDTDVAEPESLDGPSEPEAEAELTQVDAPEAPELLASPDEPFELEEPLDPPIPLGNATSTDEPLVPQEDTELLPESVDEPPVPQEDPELPEPPL